jgi:hypothetical protein
VTHKHTVGFLWKRDRLFAEPSISQNTKFTTDRQTYIFTSAGFEPAIPGSKRLRTARLAGFALVTFVFYKLQIQIYYVRKLAHLKPKAPQTSPLNVQLALFCFILLNPFQPSDAMRPHTFHLSLICMYFAH